MNLLKIGMDKSLQSHIFIGTKASTNPTPNGLVLFSEQLERGDRQTLHGHICRSFDFFKVMIISSCSPVDTTLI